MPLTVKGCFQQERPTRFELSELLTWAGHAGAFQGHLYVKADFTGCRGVGWVTDYEGVNQAYLAYSKNNAPDRGGVPGTAKNP